MTRIPVSLMAIIAILLAVSGGRAISSQDKYTVKVPGGLAFSEFRGYEGWQVVALSYSDKAVAVILANPVMIDAYRAGVPGNGKFTAVRSADAPSITGVELVAANASGE